MMKEKGATIGRFAGSSIIALTLGLAAPAFAEDQPAQPAQAALAPQSAGAEDDATSSIVVTGFRASLNKALDIKRESTAAVDAIIAEDIAKFPDQTLAESLQRIPGVRSEEQTSELQSLMRISYAVFCLKKKKNKQRNNRIKH